MGQNYSSLTDRNVGGAVTDISELADIINDKSLGSARFLKTRRGKLGGEGGLAVVVKTFVKPLPSFSLEDYRQQIQHEQEVLADIPNAIVYQRVVETEKAGYMVRQYLYSSLYDRISTRPFLEEIEKRWIAFQLLCALRDCHARGVHHGDIKAENVLVTSWNWIYLSDFASFKPTYLPEDNPADFSYFFDTSGRRICYVAPERFLGHNESREEGGLTDEMDIFSLGCVIAELFLEGTPMFTLSQLFKYRKGEYDPTVTCLTKIEDLEIRNLVQHMTNVDPAKRFSADQYLNLWRRKAFPEYFYSFLHQYIGFITDPTSGRSSIQTGEEYPRSQADDRIDRIYHDFDKISFFLGFDQTPDDTDWLEKRAASKDIMIPVHLDIPNYQRHSSLVRRRPVGPDDGTLIFLSLIASSCRNTARATARVRACDLFLAFAERITDEAKLDRCLPYLIPLLNDPAVIVRVAAVKAVAQLMELVEVASPVNAHVFPEYILKNLENFPFNENTVIRSSYAAVFASLASSASKFLDMAQTLQADGIIPVADPEAENGSAAEIYDMSRNTIVSYFEKHSKLLLTDSDAAVRRAFLKGISKLCVFFGNPKANDVVLSHLNTYLNDKDWMLRCAFFETITGVATYVGGVSLEEYILPLMVQSLTDPEEFVVEKVLISFANMAELGLFQRSKMWELIDVTGRFTMHPNIWIREGAVAFIAAATKWLSPSEVHCIINPLVRAFLRADVAELSALTILENLKRPLSRTVFDMAVRWATQAKKGVFWMTAQEQKTFAFGTMVESIPRISARDVIVNGGLRVVKNEEDEMWLAKLRNLGMSSEDEWKLVALREYIWRMAQSKPKLLSESTSSLLGSTISLKDLRITPYTIFFDENESFFNLTPPIAPEQAHNKPTTIAEALMDASRTIDNSSSSRRSLSRLQMKRSVGTDTSRRPILTVDAGSPTSFTAPIMENEGAIMAPASPLAVPQLTVNGSSESSTVASSVENGTVLRKRPSVVSLLGRGNEATKALPETSTISATAFGKVEPPFFRVDPGPVVTLAPVEKPAFKFRAAHSYDGNDPHILKLLDSVYLQNYPSDILEFGPTIAPIPRKSTIKKSSGRLPGGAWKPEGLLVAQFGEHTGAINRVVVAPDHNFFITGSDDGTVKIWDANRLEKNVTFKARQTYKHGTGVKVKALCFVENTRCFVSAASDGSIHVVKVDFQIMSTATKYGKLKVMRTWNLPKKDEVAVWVEHFKAEMNSVLLIATNKSNVYALDLKSMQILYTLHNPIHHGTPTCFCVERDHFWIILGTSNGVLDMWDLRFQLRVKSWGLPGSTPIHRVAEHPLKGRKWVVVAGGTGHGELSVWDCEKAQCREVYRAGGGKDSGKGYEAWKLDDEQPENVLARFASSSPPPSSSANGEPSGTNNVDRGIRAFTVGNDIIEDGADSRLQPGFIISAGADRKIRFWNCAKVESSMVVCGLDAEEPKPTFTTSSINDSLTLNSERVPPAEGMGAPVKAVGAVGGKSKGKGGAGRSNRSTVISAVQQGLLKVHLDTILDVAFLKVPYGMIISVDRSGVAFIYQ
ncbi:Serine/threonine-protein kinase [Rhizina undulata]